uniref:DUF4812 domain-containing protein n=1 Tax=Anopheles maculatus TaxID=74869 RepID=A0A182SFT5_9DIPT
MRVKKKVGAMDLAIGWEFRTKHEPRSQTYMDGSKPSVAPPIFEVVEPAKDLNLPAGGSANSIERKMHEAAAKHAERIERFCHKFAPEEFPYNFHQEYRCAFKAGIPQSNVSGTLSSFDTGPNGNGHQRKPADYKKLLHIPKPREPYTKKNYVIDTLAPPFAFWKKGSGYPDYWRLISVYQQAYNKPIEKRKYPLLKTVYQ